MVGKYRRQVLILPFLLCFLFLTLGPVLILVQTSFFIRGPLGTLEPGFVFDAYLTLFDPTYLRVLGNTVGLAALNTGLCIFLAYPLASYLSRMDPKKRTWFLALILVPFWTSFLVRILAFMDVLRLQPFGLDLLFQYSGVMGAMVYNYLPFAILPLYTTMEKIHDSLFEAAKDLGAGRWQSFTRVLWPLSLPGVVTSSLLVFIPSLGEYLIPEIIGGGKSFYLGGFLQNQFLTARNWPLGSAAIVILLLMSAVLLVIASLSGLLNEPEKKRSKVRGASGPSGENAWGYK